jgi:hypothetical protein
LRAFKFFSIAIATVTFISLITYFNFFLIPSSLPELYPYVGYISESELYSGGRYLFGMLQPRNNLYFGGSVGTNAAILFSLSFVVLLALKGKTGKIISIILIIGAITAQSYSTIIPLLILTFLFSAIVAGIISSIILVYIPVVDYFEKTSMDNIFVFFDGLNLSRFLFGVGFESQSNFFKYTPEFYVRDIGLFQILVEFGVISFILYIFLAMFLVLDIRKKQFQNRFIYYSIVTCLCTLFLSIHTDPLTLRPFFLLLAVLPNIMSIKDRFV